MKKNKKPTFIYIVGRGHSGSTMLELLLNRSANIAAMGEIDMLGLQIYRDERTRWVGTCSCGARPYECEYWSQVIDRVRDEKGFDLVKAPFSWRISDVRTEEEVGIKHPLTWLDYKFHRALRFVAYSKKAGRDVGGPFSSTYKQWIKNRDFVAEAYASIRGVDAVVDASKDDLQMRDIVAYSDLNVKILFLTRDVRGLAWSAIRKRRSTARKEAKSWSKLNARIIRLLEGINPDLWMQVRYEDLCSDTEGVLSKVHSFIGLPRLELSPEDEKARRHTVAGNRTRFRDLNEIREDLGWKNHLDKNELSIIGKISGAVANKLGYSF